MNKATVRIVIAAGVLAASNIATVQAQQSRGPEQGRVLSATPIHSESMMGLQRAAQRLREAIQSLAQRAPGPQREIALKSAREALYETQEAMIRLPADYRVSGMIISNVPLRQTSPAQNQTFDDSVKELRIAADRLRESIQAMADQPAGPRRNDAIKQAHEALLEAQHAMAWAWVPQQGGGGKLHGAAMANGQNAQGTVASGAGSGAVGGRTGTAAGDSSVSGRSNQVVAGGVGINARARLSDAAAPDHNVKMVFSLNTGNYLADVHVRVKDRSGRTLVDGVASGPWLYAKLPAGTYTATATYAGQSVTEKFSVAKSGQRVAHFRWPASVEQQAAATGVNPILGTGPQEPQR